MMKKSHGGDKVTIKIPRPLYERIGQLIDGAGYNSVTEFVCYVLRDVVSSHAQRVASTRPEGTVASTATDGAEYSDEEIEQVKERLRSLGYL
jgi:Arc/MetJ-type ribon-helix-helix transcriptional regulator